MEERASGVSHRVFAQLPRTFEGWISIIAGMTAIYLFVVSAWPSSGVTVNTKRTTRVFPAALQRSATEAYAQFCGQCAEAARTTDTGPCSAIADVVRRLHRSRTLTTIEVTNHSSRTVTDLRIQVPSLRDFTFSTMSGSALVANNVSEIERTIRFDPDEHILSVGPVAAIEPQSTLILDVYGEDAPVLLDGVTATYQGGAADASYAVEVTGFKARLLRLDPMLLASLGALLGTLILNGLSRTRRQKP